MSQGHDLDGCPEYKKKFAEEKIGSFFRTNFVVVVTYQYHQITMPETVGRGKFVALVEKSMILVYVTTKSARKLE